MCAGADQGEGDDNPQNVAVREDAPDPDEDQRETRGQNDGRYHRRPLSVTNSGPETVDDDAKLAADLGAKQDREQRDCSGTEERAELTERQHAIV